MKLNVSETGMALFWCPGCQIAHRIAVKPTSNPSQLVWGWNGDTENPTLTPSVVMYGVVLCHSQVTNGKIHFYEDSQHSLSGTEVELPEVPF